MISYELKCIFIHIPKCGGSSIERALWPRPEDRNEANLYWGFISKYHNKYQTGGLQHLLASQVREEVGAEIFERFYKFAFVRNPWDRIVSQFVYMQQRPDLMDYIGMSLRTEFKTYLELIQKKEHVQWMPQHKFLLDENGTLLVDQIGRLESFKADFSSILASLKLDKSMQIQHANRTDRKPIVEYYSSSEAVDMVAEIYAEDIKLLGYRFDQLIPLNS